MVTGIGELKTSEQFSIRGEGNSEESRAEGNLGQKVAEREKEVREGEQNYIIIEYWNVNIGMYMCNKKKPPPMTIVFNLEFRTRKLYISARANNNTLI
jgi:hypothetical protein